MSWSDAQEKFRRALPGFEDRPNQTALANAIEKSMANGEHLFAQAGTGTGKSYAALIPAIAHSKATGLPVVIATETKALQAQYASKDAPALQAFGIDFTVSLLKGRGNWVCRQAVDVLKPGEVFNQSGLVEELESTPDHTGDLDDLITQIDVRDTSKVTTTSDECPGASTCKFGSTCFFEKAKAKASAAQVIIVNHHLLMTDLKIRQMTATEEHPNGRASVIPEYCALIVDEAHGLIDVATDTLGNNITEKSLTRLGNDIATLLERPTASGKLASAAHSLFAQLGALLGRGKTESLTQRHLYDLVDRFRDVSDEILALRDEVKRFSAHGDDAAALRRTKLYFRANSVMQRLEDVVLANSEDLVRWVACDDFGTLALHYAPLDVAPTLAEWLWDKYPSVLMSATLAVGSDFSYMASQLGVAGAKTFDAGTPFDYPAQAALYVPRNCDPTDKSVWRAKVAQTISELATAAGGRALLLFTSRDELEAAWAATHELLEEQGLPVLKQVSGGNNKALGEAFKATEASVLFALKTFMTGFDAPGRALEVLVLNKLTFPNISDVITQARNKAHDAQFGGRAPFMKSAFMVRTVPAMTLVLLQAFGRLIRTRSDRGLVVILDSRLHDKPSYGAKILRVLPPARRLETLSEARDYLRALHSA